MKTKISTLIIPVLFVGLLTGCAATSADKVTITEQDAGKTITLKTGDTLIVSLEGNMTTGFSWIPATQTPVLLEQVGEVAVTPVSNAIGAPGKILLQFKATEKGQTNLHLDYKRSWEQGVAPAKTFDVTVVVK
ncbi:MAG: protease inhibitor I42 family protein [Chloroflexota bacterium]